MRAAFRVILVGASLAASGGPLHAQSGVATGASEPGGAADTLPPVAIPPWLVDRLDRAVEDGIREGTTPGASLVIGFGGRMALTRSWGRLDWDEGAPPVTDSTVYDLASVTKAVVTTTVAMRLWEQGRLDLDAPVSTYLPAWPAAGARGGITVRHLLNHTSGLPGSARLWRSNRGREAYLQAIAEVGLAGAPGTVQVYSDLGMIVLGMALEAVAGEPLDALARRWVSGPLDMAETSFEPLEHGIAAGGIAPTEDDAEGRPIRGTVHDLNARALGGVAGHAGLFGSARDLARFAGAALWGDPSPLACPATMATFTHRDEASSRFALGWEKPVPEVIWSDFFSEAAYGHTGFTGTSVWLDPAQDYYVVFLTNRLDSEQGEEAIHDLRRWVHRAVHGWIVDPMSAPAIARAATGSEGPSGEPIGEVENGDVQACGGAEPPG